MGEFIEAFYCVKKLPNSKYEHYVAITKNKLESLKSLGWICVDSAEGYYEELSGSSYLTKKSNLPKDLIDSMYPQQKGI